MSGDQRLFPHVSNRSEKPDQTVAIGGARPDELETPVNLTLHKVSTTHLQLFSASMIAY
jgi:hypothetical protein